MALNVVLLGQRIKATREEAGISLSGLALAAGLAKSYVLKLERGEVPNPGLATLYAIAQALNLTLNQLLAPQARPATEEDSGSEWERLEPTIPQSLAQFLDAEEKAGRPLRADAKVALAKVRYRGHQPATPEDWQFILSAIRRSVRPTGSKNDGD